MQASSDGAEDDCKGASETHAWNNACAKKSRKQTSNKNENMRENETLKQKFICGKSFICKQVVSVIKQTIGLFEFISRMFLSVYSSLLRSCLSDFRFRCQFCNFTPTTLVCSPLSSLLNESLLAFSLLRFKYWNKCTVYLYTLVVI